MMLNFFVITLLLVGALSEPTVYFKEDFTDGGELLLCLFMLDSILKNIETAASTGSFGTNENQSSVFYCLCCCLNMLI